MTTSRIRRSRFCGQDRRQQQGRQVRQQQQWRQPEPQQQSGGQPHQQTDDIFLYNKLLMWAVEWGVFLFCHRSIFQTTHRSKLTVILFE